jgi:hypothetical protein
MSDYKRSVHKLLPEELLQPQAHHCNETVESTLQTQELFDITHNAHGVADELATMLDGLTIKDVRVDGQRPARRRRTAAGLLWKGVRKKRALQQLRTKLHELQQAMILKIVASPL